MNSLQYSFIIPVYNRPDELEELLGSFLDLEGNRDFEIVVIEDGSQISSSAIIDKFINDLNISYFYKPNSGPGDSRNFGMEMLKGSIL